MSTKPRVVVADTYYQLRSQAAPGIDLFPNSELSEFFQLTLVRLLKVARFTLEEITLQQDHYHLVVKSSDVSVSWFMRTLNSIFAKKVNSHYKRRGKVFPKRFSSVIIDEHYGLKDVACHVHHNTSRLKEKQNSYQEIPLLSRLFSASDRRESRGEYLKKNSGREPYEEFIRMLRLANSIGQDYPYPQIGIIGLHAFVQDILQKHFCRLEQRKINQMRDPQRCIGSLHQKLDDTAPFKDTDLFRQGHKNNQSQARELFAVLSVALLEFSGADLARYLGVTRSAVSRMISRCAGGPPRKEVVWEMVESLK
ncbi:MAG: transposase [Chitinispirillaceae bacterium]